VATAVGRLGWRVYATNALPDHLSLVQAVLAYRSRYASGCNTVPAASAARTNFSIVFFHVIGAMVSNPCAREWARIFAL